MTSNSPGLEFTLAAYRYRGRAGLEELSVTVDRGQIVGLLGPNGSGKTTAVNLACGLLRPDAGSVRLLGDDPAGSRGRRARAQLGLVPQDSTLYPELSALEQLRLWAALHGIKRPDVAIEEVLRLADLWDRRRERVDAYSGGMRRRLALARALLSDPRVLVLDEPTLGVDIHGRRVLWDRIAALRAEGRSVLLTTNYLEEASTLCDLVVILDAGRVVASGSPDQLRAGLGGGRLTLSCNGSTTAIVAALRDHPGVLSVRGEPGRVEVKLHSPDAAGDVVRVAGAVGHVGRITTEMATLEDVFMHLTGTGTRD